MSLPAAAIAPVSGEMKPILMGPCASARPATKAQSVASRSISIVRMSRPLVPVGDRKLVGWEQRDDLGAARRHDDFFFDPRGGDAVGGRAVGLDREHHAG